MLIQKIIIMTESISYLIKKDEREAYLSNARRNGPGICGQGIVSRVAVSVQDGEDAAVVKSQKDIQSSREVTSVPELQA